MSSVRQMSLLGIQELYDLTPTQRYDEMFSSISISPIVNAVAKKSNTGAPVRLNYPAMIQSLIVRYVEKITETKLLIKRLKDDPGFMFACGFLVSDKVPSESSYSRMITKIQGTGVLEKVQTQILQDAMTDGVLEPANIAVDAGHFEARDRSPESDKKETDESKPKKRGPKPKHERAQWEKEKAEKEAALPLYEKKITDLVDATYEDLMTHLPLPPQWGIKKNSKGKNTNWFGYKGHYAVETKSQFIIGSVMSSGNLNDGKGAVPVLKQIHKAFPNYPFQRIIMDKGYDYHAVYDLIHRLKGYSIIAAVRGRHREAIGYDENFAPTCVREHSYRYDSFDHKYQTVKYTRPKECADCPLAQDTLCQKVYKVKLESNLRGYSAPARGSLAWDTVYKERSSVERVIGYLKEHFQLNNVRYRTGKRAKVHFDFVTIVYNGMKLAAKRLKQRGSLAISQAA